MFKAFKVFERGRQDLRARRSSSRSTSLSAGEVVIKAAYSSVNYKDALAATGAGKIMRRFPLIGGIDVAGTVESSADARFKAAIRCSSPATTSASRTTAAMPATFACRPTGSCPCREA